MNINLRLYVIWRKLRQFLSKGKGQELVLFLFFLFLSGCFWMIQALNETFEVAVQVPIALKDRPGDVIVLTKPPTEITVSVQDKGLALWRLLINPRMAGIKFKFSDVTVQKTAAHVRIPSKQIWDSLSVHLPSSTKFLGITKPDSVTFDYNRGQNSLFPLSFEGHVATAPHYSLESCRLKPNIIKVYASDEKRSKIDSVAVGNTVNISDLKQSGQTYIDLTAPEGVSYSPSRVALVYDVVPLVKRTMRVPVKQQNFPGGKGLRTFPSDVIVSYWVRDGHDTNLTPDSFYVSVTYEEVLQSKEKLRPHLHSKPSGASEVTFTPATVEYVIEDVVDEDF